MKVAAHLNPHDDPQFVELLNHAGSAEEYISATVGYILDHFRNAVADLYDKAPTPAELLDAMEGHYGFPAPSIREYSEILDDFTYRTKLNDPENCPPDPDLHPMAVIWVDASQGRFLLVVYKYGLIALTFIPKFATNFEMEITRMS